MHFAEFLEARLLLAGEPKFVTPIAGTANQDWSIYSYVDADPSSPGVKDYKGGPYSFDGYKGTDFTLATFAQMDAGVNVLAGAAGTVTYIHDGEFDRNITLDPNRVSNEIAIDHGNGWKTVYLHLKKSSIKVTVGQAVSAGQVIAQVGSSGNSDGPAVQFIVLHNGAVVDPYSAPATFWQNPAPYVGDAHGVLDFGITNRALVSLITERPDNSPTFSTVNNQAIYLWAIYSGNKPTDTLDYFIYKPDGTLYYDFQIKPQGTYPISFYYTSTVLNSPPAGTWHGKINYNGVQVADKTFVVNAAGSAEARVSLGSDYIRNGRTTALDFGSTYSGGINVTKTFTILNRGKAILNISQVQLPAGYVLQSAPAPTVAPDGQTTFAVQLDTLVAAGAKNGNIIVKTNDVDDANYTFAVSGIVYASAPKATIKGSVFTDPNADGLRAEGDAGINNVTVYIDTNNNNALDAGETNVKTNASGQYVLTNVNAGTQLLRIVMPAGYRRTFPVPPANFRSVTVSNGQVLENISFSNTTNILVSGVVYNDTNSNGTQDAGEAGIANVIVDILSNNVVAAKRTTDANGTWKVKGLAAGSGVAKITLPAGYTATNPSNAQYAGSLSSGQQNQNVNFGLHKTSPVPMAVPNFILAAARRDENLFDGSAPLFG